MVEVRNRKDMRAFTHLPAKLYSDDPLWVPPLMHDERKAYSAAGNPILANSEHALLMVRNTDECLGRVVVYIDPAFNNHFHTRTGLFGAFECIQDSGAAAMMIGAAESWLRERGMERVLGPLHPVAECWGYVPVDRLFGLAVHPDYQGMGLDVLLYSYLFAALKPREIRLEANYILEDNYRIRNALEKLQMRSIRSYRIFEKELS